MMSEVAFFVKDVIGPNGSVHIMDADNKDKRSDDIDSHTKTNRLKVHYSERDNQDNYLKRDEIINTEDEPDHQALCDLEQSFFLNSIRDDLDLTEHQADAVNSLKIVLAADEAYRTNSTVDIS